MLVFFRRGGCLRYSYGEEVTVPLQGTSSMDFF